MSSFYGGNPGTPFIISQTYESVKDLTSDFKSYSCPVNFGEYAIINTLKESTDGETASSSGEEKESLYSNNPQQGQLYRREYDGSATYIGCIRGPVGGYLDHTYLNTQVVSGLDITTESVYDYTDEVKYDNTTQAFDLFLGYGTDENSNPTPIKIPYVDFQIKEDSGDYKNGVKTIEPEDSAAVHLENIKDNNENTKIAKEISFDIPRGASINGVSTDLAERTLTFTTETGEKFTTDFPAVQALNLYDVISYEDFFKETISAEDVNKIYPYYTITDDGNYYYYDATNSQLQKDSYNSFINLNFDATRVWAVQGANDGWQQDSVTLWAYTYTLQKNEETNDDEIIYYSNTNTDEGPLSIRQYKDRVEYADGTGLSAGTKGQFTETIKLVKIGTVGDVYGDSIRSYEKDSTVNAHKKDYLMNNYPNYTMLLKLEES